MKKVLAWFGILLLLSLYLSSLYFVLARFDNSMELFKISMALTIIVPVLIFGYGLIRRVLRSRSSEMDQVVPNDPPKDETMEETADRETE